MHGGSKRRKRLNFEFDYGRNSLANLKMNCRRESCRTCLRNTCNVVHVQEDLMSMWCVSKWSRLVIFSLFSGAHQLGEADLTIYHAASESFAKEVDRILEDTRRWNRLVQRVLKDFHIRGGKSFLKESNQRSLLLESILLPPRWRSPQQTRWAIAGKEEPSLPPPRRNPPGGVVVIIIILSSNCHQEVK